MTHHRTVRVRRVYEEPEPADGTRVLVDRIWPRGMSKDDARLDEWCKQVAPSTELRKWYGHDIGRWEEFRARYRSELADRRPALERLRELARAGRLTLVFAARDPDHSSAAVLREVLLGG